MSLVLTDMTALRYYRFAKAGILPMPQPCNESSLAGSSATLKLVPASDLTWCHIKPSVLAGHGVVARAAVEPGLAAAAHLGVLSDNVLYDFERPPVDERDLRRQVLHNLLRLSRSVLALQDPTAVQAGGPLDDLLSYDFPRLDLLVEGDAKRHRSRGTIVHKWGGGDFPAGALMRINDSLLILSPEMLVVRLAILRPDAPHLLAMLGLELAGRYALLPEGFVDCGKLIDAGRGLVAQDGHLLGDGYLKARELLDVDRLDQITAGVAMRRGRHALETALPWICAGSESPLESGTNVSLVLPRLSGGFHAGRAELNVEVTLSEEARALNGGAPTCRIDELFVGRSGQEVAVEPGGDAWHKGAAWKKDNDRRQALEHDGYQVVAVSWDEFADFNRWRVIAEDVVARLGRSLMPASDRMRQRQAAVHADLCDTSLLRETFG